MLVSRTLLMFCVLMLVVLCVPQRVRGEHPHIIDRPIRFGEERIALTKRYIKRHYGLTVPNITIRPVAVVIHWTATNSLKGTWRGFNRVQIRSSRRHVLRGGKLNVSAHFMVGRDGRILRLMPENWMARHCILVRALAKRHPIRYLLGHMEWKRFENAPFFRERDPTYRNAKADPGKRFMRRLRRKLKDLRLRDRYP
ncbi:MAG: N-acetylmuramoyl-L-alanine amidase [Deltaproteobacteria bacterium]|nr:N-acetylmuramoyl-L-alanine amidase [Deltaproteobacteria bacterium]